MINSWDIFDTVIGRKCGTPVRLWEQVGRLTNTPNFPAHRFEAEAACQRAGGDYTLDDIYQSYAHQQHLTADEAGDLRDAEWEAELDNAFPIAPVASRIRPGDILVSDMYLNASQIRQLLDRAGIEPDTHVYVSTYGKTRNTVWPTLIAEYGQIHHAGDNRQLDVVNPKRHKVQTELITTGMTPVETAYHVHAPDIAWWCRYRRLSQLRTGTAGYLDDLQIAANMPLLLAGMQTLRTQVRDHRCRRVAFLSRDGCLAKRLWDTLYPDVLSDYVLASRECLRAASQAYVAYLDKHLTPGTMVVDFAASFRSFAVTAGRLQHKPPVYAVFYLPRPNEMATSLDISWCIRQDEVRCNNTWMEMLNYAEHWHLAGVTEDSEHRPIYDQADEYDMALVSHYHKTFDSLLSDVPHGPISRPSKVATIAAKAVEAEERSLRAIFPGHVRFENERHLPALPPSVAPQLKAPRNAVHHPTTQTCIVGAVWQHRYEVLKPWIASIELAGFRGAVHLITYECHPSTHKVMPRLHRQVQLHPGEPIQYHIVVDRFRDMATLARTLPPRAWMIHLDVTDIVCQTNPDEWLARMPEHIDIVMGSETITIGDQWWIRQNAIDTFPEHFDEMKDRLLYNAGSFAARAETMAQLCQDVWDLATWKQPWRQKNDQDALNILIHTERYRRRTHFAEQREGWCANIAASVIEPYAKGEALCHEPIPRLVNGVCFVEGDVIPCFLHHYIRNRDWKRKVLDRVIHRPQTVAEVLKRTTTRRGLQGARA